MLSIEYLTDQNGQTKAVVIPIELWRQVFPQEDMSCEEFTEAIEDYCLNQAMDEAQQSPLLAIEEALAYLEEQIYLEGSISKKISQRFEGIEKPACL